MFKQVVIRPGACSNWIGRPTVTPRLPTRHFGATHQPRTIGFASVGKFPVAPFHGKVQCTRGYHHLPHSPFPNAPPPGRRRRLRTVAIGSLAILLFILPILCHYRWLESKALGFTAASAWHVLESVEPENRPPELVRMYLLVQHMRVARSYLGSWFAFGHRPCSCHLDGLATTKFTIRGSAYPDKLKGTDLWPPMLMWLEEAQVVEPEPQQPPGNDRQEAGTAITLYTYIHIQREHLDKGIELPAGVPLSRWTDYEAYVLQHVEQLKKARGAAGYNTTKFAVVVLFINAYMVLDYDEQKLHVKREGRALDTKFPTDSVGFHWMPHPGTGRQASGAQTAKVAGLYDAKFEARPCRYSTRNSSPRL
ncbi:hypothetical protein PG984_011902 [Apiospora sp. TS-2023a]